MSIGNALGNSIAQSVKNKAEQRRIDEAISLNSVSITDGLMAATTEAFEQGAKEPETIHYDFFDDDAIVNFNNTDFNDPINSAYIDSQLARGLGIASAGNILSNETTAAISRKGLEYSQGIINRQQLVQTNQANRQRVYAQSRFSIGNSTDGVDFAAAYNWAGAMDVAQAEVAYGNQNAEAFNRFMNDPTTVRVLSTLQTIEGAGFIIAGGLLSSTGLGAVVGVPLAAYGADMMWTGAKSFNSGTYQQTMTNSMLVNDFGLSPNQAMIAELSFGVGGIYSANRVLMTKGIDSAGNYDNLDGLEWNVNTRANNDVIESIDNTVVPSTRPVRDFQINEGVLGQLEKMNAKQIKQLSGYNNPGLGVDELRPVAEVLSRKNALPLRSAEHVIGEAMIIKKFFGKGKAFSANAPEALIKINKEGFAAIEVKNLARLTEKDVFGAGNSVANKAHSLLVNGQQGQIKRLDLYIGSDTALTGGLGINSQGRLTNYVNGVNKPVSFGGQFKYKGQEFLIKHDIPVYLHRRNLGPRQ